MPGTVALTCNHCGALLRDVPDEIRFVSCEHCGARLRIQRTDGAVFTEVLEAVERVAKQSSATAASVRVIERERELEKLDASIAKLGVPASSRVIWLVAAIGVLGSMAVFLDDGEARAMGIVNLLFFGGCTFYLALTVPQKRRRYEQERARLDAQRAECAEKLEAARAAQGR